MKFDGRKYVSLGLREGGVRWNLCNRAAQDPMKAQHEKTGSEQISTMKEEDPASQSPSRLQQTSPCLIKCLKLMPGQLPGHCGNLLGQGSSTPMIVE